MRISLNWAGPYSWTTRHAPTIFQGDHAEAVGLYLWCIPHQGTHLVYYVGQTEAGFGRRHYQHFREYAGGSYTIHDAAAFRNGRHKPLYATRPYAKDPWRRVQPFIDRFSELSRNLVELLETIVIFVAPLAQPQRIHRRLEAAIVDELYRAEPPSVRFQDPGMRVHRRRQNEVAIDVSSTPRGLFRGLPENFEA